MLFLALLLACTIYARSLRGEFLFDDWAIADMDFPRRAAIFQGLIDFDDPGNNASPPVAIADLIADKSLCSALRSFFLESRALTHMGYLWTWRFARLDPPLWHTVNLCLHLANIILVYMFARFFLPVEAAGIAAVLFAVHPHQVAAVSYISGRASLQCTFFSLAAIIIIYSGSIFTLWKLPGLFLACLFAQRSKEDAPLWLVFFAASYAAFRFFFASI